LVKVKEKYFKTECSPEGILINVNATVYCKFKLIFKLTVIDITVLQF
jgi:hypothetical protein